MAHQSTEQDAPLLNHMPLAGVDDEFIISYKHGVTGDQRREHQAALHNIVTQKPGFSGIGETWDMGGFQGYHVHMDPADLTYIDRNLVANIEPNGVVTACTTEEEVLAGKAMINQAPSTWGLGRISHHNKGYHNYIYNESAGSGVKIYVLDTGILTTHNEFGGRASWGHNFIPNSPDTDENGHGTHCAGTAIGATYGVSKKAFAIAVKVLNKNGSGYWSQVISGINWAYNNAGINRNKAVISMSLGGKFSQVVNDAVASATSGGMTVSVSAGNKNANVSGYSPASEESAVTVAAINSHDHKASFSNWGAGVDVFAAGVHVTSAWIGSDSATKTISGTSMSCPHVSGLAAYYIRLYNLSGKAVKGMIISSATTGLVINTNGSPNRIAYNNSGA
ncbi:putative subtilisin-like protein [Rosellinia necatrix]|uniref:Putative subtilisin-like protein n=1 Tax=Rosellinia necatrix TaxID=77044 RepID=A0A1W2TS88_ROSNE|nr:putative subtilisin-like protein [Rosellinia necatrix]